MTDVTLMPDREWTVEDLDDLPDDGYRYELVDGVLLVSSAPSEEHQIASGNLYDLLRSAAPTELRVLYAPYAVRLGPSRQLEPDLLVVPKDRSLPDRQPVLVVEVLSPSTRVVDVTLKRHVFEAGGVPHYWLVDPLTPSVQVLELRDGAYAEVVTARADEPVAVTLPFPVTFTPNDLLV